MSSTIASFFSSFVSTVHADADKPAEEANEVVEAAAEEEPEPEDVRVSLIQVNSFMKHSHYRSNLSFAMNVRRRRNALL